MKLNKNKIKFLSVVIFLYVILFEFIIPANKYFPKPSIIYDTFFDLLNDYNLMSSLILTGLVILSALLFSYLLIYLVRGNLMPFLEKYNNISEVLKVFEVVPFIFIPIVLIFWVGASFLTEVIFVFVIAVAFWLFKVESLQKFVKQSYIDSAKSLNIPKSKIYKDIYWKSIEPQLIISFRKLNIYLWSVAILFEYIVGYFGVGSVYFQAYMYKDISAVFTLTIILSVIICIFDLFLLLIDKQIIFWSSEK